MELSASKQLAMRHILKDHLERVSFSSEKLARFFPLPRNPLLRDATPILVTPFVSFGNPVIARIGISTNVIASRVNLGESEQDIVEDYELTKEEFEEAILYESAA